MDSPPAVITEGGLFKSGPNAELDHLLDLAEHGEQSYCWPTNRPRQAHKLKLGYNRVFGYYYEERAAHSGPAPFHFIRRQSLANTEALYHCGAQELEEKLLSASDKRKSLEYTLFSRAAQRRWPASANVSCTQPTWWPS